MPWPIFVGAHSGSKSRNNIQNNLEAAILNLFWIFNILITYKKVLDLCSIFQCIKTEAYKFD